LTGSSACATGTVEGVDHQTHEIVNKIVAWHRANENCRKLPKMPGIGPITASAMVASLGDAKSFKNGRWVSAWLELVLKQNSTGCKTVLNTTWGSLAEALGCA
jgi:transposase